jgi:membrane protease YdiL (CAAX protease family)
MPKRFQLVKRPWLTLLIYILAEVIALFFFAAVVVGLFKQPQDAPLTGFITTTLAHITVLFLLFPFVLKLPEGSSSFRAYLDVIRLSRVRPFFRLLLLALSCYLILALCQMAGVLVFRASQNLPITLEFIRRAFNLAPDLPPESLSWLVSIPSIFEEIAFRGVLLSAFLSRYPKPQAILYSAVGFGMIHLLNLASGKELTWVLGQVVWATILGLFYSILVLRSNNLWPAMLFHYLGNLFVGSLTAYLQTTAPTGTQVVYGILFSFGLIPTTLMILWVFLFEKLWPLAAQWLKEPGRNWSIRII